jgi:hypothetical protein
MTITSVLESALTASPTLTPTEAMVPEMGLESSASSRDCCASTRFALAVSIAASSEAICSALSDAVDPDPTVPVLPLLAPVVALEVAELNSLNWESRSTTASVNLSFPTNS